MQLQGIVRKHQVLENEISAAYKDEILSTDTTYQLVTPNDHHRNTTKGHLNLEGPLCWFPQWNGSDFSHALLVPSHPTSQTTAHASTKVQRQPKIFCLRLRPRLRPHTTTMLLCSFSLAWNNLAMTSPANVKVLPSIARRVLS